MPSYTNEAILGLLLEMQREFTRAAKRGHRRRVDPYDDEVDDEQIGAAVLFVKYLSARAGDVFLLGSTALVGLQIDELENRRRERTEEDLGIGRGQPHAAQAISTAGSRTYSSDDLAATLTVLDAYEKTGRISGAMALGDGWIANAATFVKRLAAEASDVPLIGRAEVFVLDEDRRRREQRERSRQEDEERERQQEEEQSRKWNAYEWVADSMLGDRLQPKVSGRDVKSLLEKAGLIAKVARKWVLTEAGVKYANPQQAKVGEAPGWPAWSKSVLEILQRTLDEYIHERDCGPGDRAPE